MRAALVAGLAALALAAGCGSDDGDGTTGTAVAPSAAEGDLVAVAEGTASCLREDGFSEALTTDVFLPETGEAIAPADGYSVLAVTADGRDVQVMIFTDAAIADNYVADASSDDNITRETVAGDRVVVESGFRAENSSDLEEPAGPETTAAIESCVTGAGL